jgi:hypothetical protein
MMNTNIAHRDATMTGRRSTFYHISSHGAFSEVEFAFRKKKKERKKEEVEFAHDIEICMLCFCN